MAEYDRIQKKQESRAVANKEAEFHNTIGFIDKRPRIVTRVLLGTSPMQRDRIVQLKWTAIEEGNAQEKLAPMDKMVKEVPINNILNQQLWAPVGYAYGAVNYGKGFLQAINADKVLKIVDEILGDKKVVNPPPVAFSTDTALEADLDNGELILLDSHHTINAIRSIFEGEHKMPVKHFANPNMTEGDSISNIAKRRISITNNKNIAAEYNLQPKVQAILAHIKEEVVKKKSMTGVEPKEEKVEEKKE